MGADEELYKIARSKAGSSNYETRQAGQQALDSLIERNATKEVSKIADDMAGSSHYETRQAGLKALNALKKMD
jgi:hypothetical protein